MEAIQIFDRKQNGKLIVVTPMQGALILIAVALTAASLVFAITGSSPVDDATEEVPESETESPAIEAENYDEFQRALELILQDYVDEESVTPESLIQGAIKGMVEGVGDPYSTYFDSSALEDLRMQTLEGEYSGIGVSVIDLDGYVTVLVPFSNTPASTTPPEEGDGDEEEGLSSGDRIISVDGVDTVGMSTEHVSDLIRGPEGETVEVVVQRPEDTGHEELTFIIERQQIEIPTADSEVLEGDIGLLSITQFTAHTPKQVETHLQGLISEGISGLILDLRSNPGGTLDESLEVADQLLPPGPIVTTVDRDGKEETLSVDGPGCDLPIVVLVDNYSASASEILAGALRDRLDAPLVGERTFGKGSVQRIYYLDLDRTTGMKLTTQRYLTPSGYSIEEEDGLAPDHEVPRSEEDVMGELDSDPQLQKALDVMRDTLED
ncbi:MAG: S41 family peptidase [Clostridia bacterium]